MRNLKKNEGITLIALIVTIIVLIILAVVSINTIFGEDGIIARAELAKTETEKAQIKEEAEMLKASLQMDVYEGKIEELNKTNLASALKEHFAGSSLDGENVVVSNGKYAIVIGDDLSIEVTKNGESSGGNTGSGDNSGSGDEGSGDDNGEQSGTIEIAYEIEDVDENTKIINLSYSGDMREMGAEDYENFIEELYETSIPEEMKEEWKEIAQTNNISYEEILLEVIMNGEPLTSDVRAQGMQIAEQQQMTYREILEMSIEQQGITLQTTLTEEANIENQTFEIQNSQIVAKKSGTYKISVTDGVNNGEIEIEVTGIVNEKFSSIYEASADYTDSLGNKARIPKGFAVGTSSDINSIDKGLVITDSVDANGYSNGNEYVWVPVSNINGDGSNKIKIRNTDGTTKQVEITLGRYTFDATNGIPTKVQYGSEYANETETSYREKELKNFRVGANSNLAEGINETAKDLAGFVTSVANNGGFFIARYEASYESGSSVTDYKLASKVSSIATDEESETLIKGQLWNYINQDNIAKVCKNMYTESYYTDVEADLINSYAWDTAIIFIQNCSNNSNYANANCQTNGNYNVLKNTGVTGDVVCNIYDMAGNLAEWTTEYRNKVNSYDFTCINRGGYYRYNGCYTNTRIGQHSSYVELTGRPLLYNANPGT